IEVIGSLRANGIVFLYGEGVCRVVILLDVGRSDRFEGGRGEVARVPGMDDGISRGLQGDIDARTELVLMGKLVHHIETPAEIHRERRRVFPFVLEIDAVEPTASEVLLGNGERDIADLVPEAVSCKDGGWIVRLLLGVGEGKATPEGVLLVQLVTRVEFQAV